MSVNEISHRLASAQSAALDLKKRVGEQTAAIEAGQHLRKDKGVELPFVPSLQILFEGYYYNLKNVIRDLGGVPMKVLYGKRFEEASCWFSFKEGKEPEVSKHLRRLEATHAGYSTVRELIDRNKQNFQHVVTVRNALEHRVGVQASYALRTGRLHRMELSLRISILSIFQTRNMMWWATCLLLTKRSCRSRKRCSFSD